ncbi:MAG: o-succinylbenzoate--CoA ligase [Spirochaetes bacterium GWD1_27_9]|nr:MAG: o-succinylbenzoate--CoA ligase [Spirochaetes bacterium GWB1_27_13]OHD20351.1 MAG: o-succinylbenzoate--CoA ligase [Spirochaetes bacterium GWC1_27_15]OHD35573.1 MAG: o-succinylbenzoate--CoA ligase [Spirochaetes bacterium GWD1_27_9]
MGFEFYFDLIKSFGDKIAVVYKDNKYSYNNLLEEINSMKKFLLANNVKNNEIVSILSDYSFRSIALFFALIENRNIIVPITSKIDNEITERIIESYSDRKIILTEESIQIETVSDGREKHKLLKEVQDKNNAGLILFSSGSTGKPKAMVHNLDNLVESYKDKKPKDQIMLVFLMFDHIGGLNTLFNALSMGSTIVIPENRDAKYICTMIAKHKIGILPASPTFLNLILMSEAHKDLDLSSLSLITYGTEPMPESLLTKLQVVFPNVKFLQTFGTSETGITKTSSKSSTSTLIKINDPNTEYKIVEGELWLKSKTQVLGYLNATMDNFTEDGWYKTGDLVELADDGYLRIVGRIKELINVGGQKVLPEEVEKILLDMPEIADCMVFGEKNAITGQCVAADVVLKEGIEPKSIRSLVRNFCMDKLDSYKIPAKITVVDKTNFNDRFKKIRRK